MNFGQKERDTNLCCEGKSVQSHSCGLYSFLYHWRLVWAVKTVTTTNYSFKLHVKGIYRQKKQTNKKTCPLSPSTSVMGL